MQLNNIDSDKCTEVFRVILNSACKENSIQGNIELVNYQVEKIINKVVSKFLNNISKIGLERTNER